MRARLNGGVAARCLRARYPLLRCNSLVAGTVLNEYTSNWAGSRAGDEISPKRRFGKIMKPKLITGFFFSSDAFG